MKILYFTALLIILFFIMLGQMHTDYSGSVRDAFRLFGNQSQPMAKSEMTFRVAQTTSSDSLVTGFDKFQ